MSLFLKNLPKPFFRAFVPSCSIFDNTSLFSLSIFTSHLTRLPNYFINKADYRTLCYSLNKDKKKQFVKKYAICNEKCYSKKSSGCGINDKDIESPLDREEISEAKVQCTKKMKASCSHQNAKCAKKEKIPISKKPIRKPNKLTAERCTESETDKVDQSPILLSIHQCKSCQKKKSKPVCKEKTKEEDEKQIDEKEIDQSPVLLCVDKCKEIEEKKNKEEKIDTATVDKSPMMLSVDQCREDLKKKVENKKEQELAKVNVDQSPMLLSVGECRKHKKSVKDAKKKKTSRSSKEREECDPSTKKASSS